MEKFYLPLIAPIILVPLGFCIFILGVDSFHYILGAISMILSLPVFLVLIWFNNDSKEPKNELTK